MAVLDGRLGVVDHRVARLEQRPRHQQVLAELRAREGMPLPQLAADGRGHVVEVVEQAPRVGVERGVVARQAHLAALGGVARIAGAEHARQELGVVARQVAAVSRPDRRVGEIAVQARQPLGPARDRVLRQEDQQLALALGRQRVARVAVVELERMDAPQREGHREALLPALEDRQRSVARARVDHRQVPGHRRLLRGQRGQHALQELRALEGRHEHRDRARRAHPMRSWPPKSAAEGPPQPRLPAYCPATWAARRSGAAQAARRRAPAALARRKAQIPPELVGQALAGGEQARAHAVAVHLAVEGRVDAVAQEGLARAVVVRVVHDARGHEADAVAGGEHARGPGEILAEGHVGEGVAPEDRGAHGARDIVEAQPRGALLGREGREAADAVEVAHHGALGGLGQVEHGALGQEVVAGVRQHAAVGARHARVVEGADQVAQAMRVGRRGVLGQEDQELAARAGRGLVARAPVAEVLAGDRAHAGPGLSEQLARAIARAGVDRADLEAVPVPRQLLRRQQRQEPRQAGLPLEGRQHDRDPRPGHGRWSTR